SPAGGRSAPASAPARDRLAAAAAPRRRHRAGSGVRGFVPPTRERRRDIAAQRAPARPIVDETKRTAEALVPASGFCPFEPFPPSRTTNDRENRFCPSEPD